MEIQGQISIVTHAKEYGPYLYRHGEPRKDLKQLMDTVVCGDCWREEKK